MLANHLRTEYLKNPLAIDIVAPRFFWRCVSGNAETTQCAYRITARNEAGEPLWDSGKVKSARSTHIPYEGAPLTSRARVCWRVKLWDETGFEGEWSEEASFEIGLISPSDWSAKWITAPFVPSKKQKHPTDCFQKTVNINAGMKSARLYATANGLYFAQINGVRVGEDRLTPGYTDYSRRVQYQTYDVAHLLLPGENTLAFTLGDGWFRGSIGAYNRRCVYGTRTKLLAQLEVNYADGSRQVFGTDGSFLWSNSGPIRENDLKDGEVFDAGRLPEYCGRALETTCKAKIVCSNNVSVREHERLPARLIRTPNGQNVLDFSQNIAGYVECAVPAAPGRTATLRFGETLDAEGNFTQAGLQISKKPKHPTLQRVQITCAGEPVSYKPSFCVLGFRYVLLENWPGVIDPADFTAVAVYSDMVETGEFSCDNALVNRLFENTRWSMKSNFLDVPTDCPQRERNPWTGDAQVFFETGAYLMDLAPFMRKWLTDIADSQKRNGCVRSLAPHGAESWFVRGMDGSVGWADAIILIPYRYDRLYHDEPQLRALYPAMRRYAEFMIRRCRRLSLLTRPRKNPYRRYTYSTGQHWGEWAEPKEDHFEGFFALGLPRPEEATAYMAYSMRCLSSIAGKLGMEEDATRYGGYADGAAEAYRYLFVKNDDIVTDRPAKLVRPLALDLLDEPAKTNVAQRLNDVMKQRGYTVGTGFLSTPFLLGALSDNGFADAALRTLLQEGTPGWLYQLRHGATTIWENWEGTRADGSGSLNHYSKGAVCQWLMQTLGGIRMDEAQTFLIRPLINRRVGDVRCAYESLYGRVACNWTLEGSAAHIVVTLPANTSARVCLPDGSEYVVTGGEHAFSAMVN
ncbi:MAG TPA: family 78 glycoside hydrolase catalytic domain [Eubacteriales bacterium]|nr:family 78 glycoside hydrolase catalytic domain [Eubacteriales bacterium]